MCREECCKDGPSQATAAATPRTPRPQQKGLEEEEPGLVLGDLGVESRVEPRQYWMSSQRHILQRCLILVFSQPNAHVHSQGKQFVGGGVSVDSLFHNTNPFPNPTPTILSPDHHL